MDSKKFRQTRNEINEQLVDIAKLLYSMESEDAITMCHYCKMWFSKLEKNFQKDVDKP